MKVHTVERGDCIESLAAEHGFAPKTIWLHPGNEPLRNTRKEMNLLQPGDRVTIPDLEPKQESRPTEKRHTFKRKGVVCRLRVRLMSFDKPLGNRKATVTVDGSAPEHTTSDADGWIEHPIRPTARHATIRLGEGDTARVIELALGHVDPLETTSGVRHRLTNLGFDCSSESGEEVGPRTEGALLAFQKKHGLEETGEADEATRSRLKSEYGC